MTYTHYLIVKNHTAIGVNAKDDTDAMAQALAMGIQNSVVRVDASLDTVAATAAKAAGFSIVETGGSCTAYRKDYGTRYVLITGEDGTDHRLADLSDSYLVGAYDTTTGEELGMLIADAASLSTIEQAIEAANRLGKSEAFKWDTKLAIRVAKAFGEKLQEALTARQMREVIYLNKCEPEGSNVCHSHDFCDANMVMLDGMADVLGMAASDVADLVFVNGAHQDLWNASWDIAVAADFFI